MKVLLFVALFLFVQSDGLRLATKADNIPLNNGFQAIHENPVFIFACCVLEQAGITDCNSEFCTTVTEKVQGIRAALEDVKESDASLEVHKEMRRKMMRRAALLETKETITGKQKLMRRKKALMNKIEKAGKDGKVSKKNPYTTHLWPEGKVYLEISPALLGKWVLGEAPAVWLISWLLKTISEYEAHTCLQIWVMPPVTALAHFIGIDGFLGLPVSVSVIMHDDDSGFTAGLGLDAGSVEWSIHETVRGVQHELGHIFGMDHLQKRKDRDSFITFSDADCRTYFRPMCDLPFSDPGTAKSSETETSDDCVESWVAQYAKDETLAIDVVVDTFNYGSIMAYPYDPCIQPQAAPLEAFKTRADHPPFEPYANGVTPLDYDQIRKMYNCPAPVENAILAIGGAVIDASRWIQNTINAIIH